MGELRDRMDADLRLACYSPVTRRCYVLRARAFAKHFMRSPEEMGEAEIREYLLYMVEERRISRGGYGQVRAALKFLYTVTLRRPTEVAHVPVPRRRVVLPVVLHPSEVQAVLSAIRSATYRVISMVVYGSGLRTAEACRLRPEDIDSARMLIHVRCGKGAKDRYTLLSLTVLHALREYWRTDRPASEWLFPAQSSTGHASRDVTRRVLRRAAADAGITKPVTPRVLRHCFATHLVESGVDLTVVKALLGHASVQTTQVYTHVSLEHLGRMTSPLDRLLLAPNASRRRR